MFNILKTHCPATHKYKPEQTVVLNWSAVCITESNNIRCNTELILK